MTDETTQIRYRVSGMDCASCAARIEGAACRVEGVEDISVSVANRSMVVSHLPHLDRKTLEKRIGALGYELEPERPGSLPAIQKNSCCGQDDGASPVGACCGGEPSGSGAHASKIDEASTTTRFTVGGMDCAGCASKVEGAALRVPGVEKVAVSLAAGSLNVTHRAGIALNDVERRVQALGYEIQRAEQEENAGTVSRQDGYSAQHLKNDNAARPWCREKKTQLTAWCGGALVVAAVLGQILPAYDFWFFTLAMLVGLVPVARRAIMGAILAGMPFSIEMLMTIAAVGAVAIGATQEAATVVFLFLVGELLEGVAAGRARSSISALSDLVPRRALLEIDGTPREVAAESLSIGDIVIVRPGDRLPADGIVVSGESALDQAPVTGESTPVHKGVGDGVFAGTINGAAVLRIRVTAAAEDNTIARVVRLVAEAQESEAPTERFIDRFSRYYTPAVVAVGALVASVPPLVFGAAWNEWIYKGLAILLIGCPCALVISTPAAIAASLSAGARKGLLIKGGAVLETLGQVTAAAFDKTGTLTKGKPQVTDIIPVGCNEEDVLSLAAALEAGSNHPLASAIIAKAHEDNISFPTVERSAAIGGKGVTGSLDGAELFFGSLAAARELAAVDAAMVERAQALNNEGKSVAVLLKDAQVVGLIAMRDEPRPDAAAALAELSRNGIRTIMLTGDNRRTADAISNALGIEAKADLMPADKQRIVGELQAEGHKVVKIGDGINDAPALAAADVGVAMGGGTDVALETGDAASLHGRVGDIMEMIALSRRTMRNIKQNISIALGLKAVFLITTIAGVTGLWPAILADTGATVLVTANALRLLRLPKPSAASAGIKASPTVRLPGLFGGEKASVR